MRLGDLDALKKAINDFYDNHFKGLVPNELITYAKAVDNAIDNAPTVELNDKSLEIARKSIELGRKVGKLEGKLEKRPQGEWILGKSDSGNYLKCPKCNFIEWQNLSAKYCSNCGADMRKGGAE